MIEPNQKQIDAANFIVKELRTILQAYKPFCLFFCYKEPAWYKEKISLVEQREKDVLAEKKSIEKLSDAIWYLIDAYIEIRDEHLVNGSERTSSAKTINKVFAKLVEAEMMPGEVASKVAILLEKSASPHLIASLHRSPLPRI